MGKFDLVFYVNAYVNSNDESRTACGFMGVGPDNKRIPGLGGGKCAPGWTKRECTLRTLAVVFEKIRSIFQKDFNVANFLVVHQVPSVVKEIIQCRQPSLHKLDALLADARAKYRSIPP